MSSTSTPAASQSGSGYASPAHPSTVSSSKPKSKPGNVFSNDGSFLERFQHLKKDEEEKKKQEDTMAKKRAFDSRFKTRGKRPPPDDSNSNATIENPSKKTKADTALTQYEKEMKNFAGRSLKDDGIGVRPLVK